MRSHEERFAGNKAAHRRKTAQGTAATQYDHHTFSSALAACLVLIVGVSFAMPGMVAGVRPGDFAGYETAASMYGGGAALGYIVIGLLSFLLGVCVTVLCFRLRQMNREDDQDKESEDAHGAD